MRKELVVVDVRGEEMLQGHVAEAAALAASVYEPK